MQKDLKLNLGTSKTCPRQSSRIELPNKGSCLKDTVKRQIVNPKDFINVKRNILSEGSHFLVFTRGQDFACWRASKAIAGGSVNW